MINLVPNKIRVTMYYYRVKYILYSGILKLLTAIKISFYAKDRNIIFLVVLKIRVNLNSFFQYSN